MEGVYLRFLISQMRKLKPGQINQLPVTILPYKGACGPPTSGPKEDKIQCIESDYRIGLLCQDRLGIKFSHGLTLDNLFSPLRLTYKMERSISTLGMLGRFKKHRAQPLENM